MFCGREIFSVDFHAPTFKAFLVSKNAPFVVAFDVYIYDEFETRFLRIDVIHRTCMESFYGQKRPADIS